MLSEEQLNHYKRHIVIPEIGKQGQRKLLNSTAFVYCENADSLRPLAYYLAALGTGKIFCFLEKNSGFDSLILEVSDLNNDTLINLSTEQNSRPDYRIVLGSINFVKKLADKLLGERFVPTIISINSQWKGTLKTSDNPESLINFIHSLYDVNYVFDENKSYLFANAVSGTLCAIEAVKLCLNIGIIQKDMLLYDLLNMEFTRTESYIKIFEKLKDANNDIKKTLSRAKVLVVGTGGLGSPAAYALTIAGVNTLGLLDLDVVEMSNLNRQILHSFSRIGMPKAKSAEFLLKKINPDININTYITKLTQDNAETIISKYDLIVAAVDNIKTRYLINDTCFLLKKPVVEAGVLSFHGTATTIIPGEGHCYRCLYPNIDSSLSTVENGVLGPVPGVMGFIQATEAVKVITGFKTTLKNKILLFDSLDMDFNIVEIQKNPECPTCGKTGNQIKI